MADPLAAEAMVEAATSESLMMPDWGANIEISDLLSSDNPDSARRVMRPLHKKLLHGNPKVVALALTLLDTLLKNGGRATHTSAASKEVQSALKALCEGRAGPDAQAQAATLVQELALAYRGVGSLPYAATYSELQGKGVRFPAPPADAATASAAMFAYSPAAAAAAVAAAGGAGAVAASSQPAPAPAPPVPQESMADASSRLWSELGTVRGHVAAAATMVTDAAATAASASTASGTAPRLAAQAPFLDAVDFLEQAGPRLVALINAGAAGAMASDEALFEEILTVHDGVARVVEVAGPIASGAVAVPSAAVAAAIAPLVQFARQAPPQPAAAPAVAPAAAAAVAAASGGASAGAGAVAADLDGLFAGSSPAPAPTAAPAAAVAATTTGGAAFNPFDTHDGADGAPAPPPGVAAKASFAPTAASGGDDFDSFGVSPAPAAAAPGGRSNAASFPPVAVGGSGTTAAVSAGGAATKPASSDSTLADLEALLN